MIDVKVLRLDSDRVQASQRARGESESLVDDLIKADEARRNAIAQFEELRAEQKALGKKVAQAAGADRTELLSQTRELADLVKKATATWLGLPSGYGLPSTIFFSCAGVRTATSIGRPNVSLIAVETSR